MEWIRSHTTFCALHRTVQCAACEASLFALFIIYAGVREKGGLSTEIDRTRHSGENGLMNPLSLLAESKKAPETARMPALFVGHGSPMNGIEDNAFSRGWRTLGETLPRPTAILSVSAHWLTEGTRVHAKKSPRTIHDFWGFPKTLYDLSYPCPGSPAYAAFARKALSPTNVTDDYEWGIDHGTWIVLHRMYPDADIPVFQLSIDIAKSHAEHYELAKSLGALRRRGVLILGSGNIVHNLGMIDFDEHARSFDWAEEFDGVAKELIEKREHERLIGYERLGTAARLSIPTPDHFWPLLYVLALQEDDEGASFPIDGLAHGSVSMRSVLVA